VKETTYGYCVVTIPDEVQAEMDEAERDPDAPFAPRARILIRFFRRIERVFRHALVPVEYQPLAVPHGRIYRVALADLQRLPRGPAGVHVEGFLLFPQIPEPTRALLRPGVAWLPVGEEQPAAGGD